MEKTARKNKTIRLGIQLVSLVLVFLVSLNHKLVNGGISIPSVSAASLHSICPFGSVASLYSLLTEGSFVQKVHESSLIILGIVILLGILFGPVFCGWICPLGTVQELLAKLGRKIFKNRYNRFIPYKYHKYFGFFRYFVLLWVIYMTGYTGKLVFSEIDPYYALFNLWTSEAAIGGIIVLCITLISSLFIERPWCKYACPLGAFLGLTNLFRIFKITRNASTCIGCQKCNDSCPMNIPVSDRKAVRNHQCISCLECTSEVACPIEDTVVLRIKGVK